MLGKSKREESNAKGLPGFLRPGRSAFLKIKPKQGTLKNTSNVNALL